MSDSSCNQTDIFSPRTSLKPFEYPQFEKFIKAINHSFWTVDEYNFQQDIQDFKVNLSDVEREIIKRTMLAISTIEVKVKNFYGISVPLRFPKPEIQALGSTFSENEVRHELAYSHLLELLGFNEAFKEVETVPAIADRLKYLGKYKEWQNANKDENFLKSLILFALFIEGTSLMSQFVIMQSFKQYKNLLKGIDTVVNATSREECYISGTEVLTPSGWHLIENMSVGDDIFQYNEDGTFELTKVQHTTSSQFEGDLLRFSTIGRECIVTPGHDMIHFTASGRMKKTRAEDMKFNNRKAVPIGGQLHETQQGRDLTFEERLRIAIQADGTNLYWVNVDGEKLNRGKEGGYTHSLRLSKQRKQKRLEWILNNLNYDWKKRSTNYENKPNELEYQIRYNHDVDYKKFDEWVDLTSVDLRWCKQFIDELLEWDGYQDEDHTGYCSTVKSNIDVAQVIAILAGYFTNIIEGKESERKSHYKNCYRLSIMKDRNLRPLSHSIKKNEYSYEGTVHCVTVPSGVIMTRHNDQTFIAGNCLHAQAAFEIINILRKEHLELFTDEVEGLVYGQTEKAFVAERKVMDWIFEKGELEFLSREVLEQFLQHRYDFCLTSIGFDAMFDVDRVPELEWFEVSLKTSKANDFFNTRSVDYARSNKSFEASELF